MNLTSTKRNERNITIVRGETMSTNEFKAILKGVKDHQDELVGQQAVIYLKTKYGSFKLRSNIRTIVVEKEPEGWL